MHNSDYPIYLDQLLDHHAVHQFYEKRKLAQPLAYVELLSLDALAVLRLSVEVYGLSGVFEILLLLI